MQAIITGSRAYGKPRDDSDLDIVLLVQEWELHQIRKAHEAERRDRMELSRGDDAGYGEDCNSWHFYFGRVNLIVTTDPVTFAVWQKGTEQLQEKKGLTDREDAVLLFKALRELHNVYGKLPSEKFDLEI